MTRPLQLLMIEDSEDDALLLIRQLRRAGFDPVYQRIDTEDGLRTALASKAWDIIICDHAMPQFSAPKALSIFKSFDLDLPFIIVSGTIGEESAVECMRHGAHDFVLKGNLTRLVATVEREIAEASMRRQLRLSQEALAQTEKLRTLGQMAAGISHDLKNILSPLSLHLQFMERALSRGQTSDAAEAIADMKEILQRGLQTIERLRDFSRQAPESKAEIVDLNHVAHEAAELSKPRMASRGRSVCVIQEKFGEIPHILGRSAEIMSSITNLVVNAIDAMSTGGIITIRTGKKGSFAWVEVADNGPGIPPEVAERVFEPFFSTKGQDGTGLGLAMVYACMLRHDGSVSLKTSVGNGATFTLWFPALNQQ